MHLYAWAISLWGSNAHKHRNVAALEVNMRVSGASVLLSKSTLIAQIDNSLGGDYKTQVILNVMHNYGTNFRRNNTCKSTYQNKKLFKMATYAI